MNKIEFELGGMLARRDIDQMGLETANKSLENRHQLDMKEITRLTNENHRLRAALVWIDGYSQDTCDDKEYGFHHSASGEYFQEAASKALKKP